MEKVTINIPYMFMITPKRVYSVLMALIPVLIVYRAPIIGMSLSTVLGIILAPYAFITFSNGKKWNNSGYFLLLIGYLSLRSLGSYKDLLIMAALIIHLLGAVNDSIDVLLYQRTIKLVAVVSTFLVLVQTVCYYLLGVKINYLYSPLLLDSSYNTILHASRFFRPSAMFLEPSHYAQYCCLALIIALLPIDGSKSNIPQAIWIALGVILSTSGMGIVLVLCIFLWFFAWKDQTFSGRVKRLLGGGGLMLVGFLVLNQFSFFQQAFARINNSDPTQSRTMNWKTLDRFMASKNRLLGMGGDFSVDYYLTGAMQYYLCYGLIGIILFLITCIAGIIQSKNNHAICVWIVYLGLFFLANLTSVNGYLFWWVYLLSLTCFSQKISAGLE